MELPLTTHRYLLEPVGKVDHVRLLLAKLFLGFIDQIQKSLKLIPAQLLNKVKNDVRSTTGKNLRKLMLLTQKSNIDELLKMDYEN